jgi:accessory gene regulator B
MQLSEKFARKLIERKVISKTDADVYIFGFYQTVMLLINVTTTLVLSILFKLVFPCILLNISYISIRISAGGHHANNAICCYINSTLMIAGLLAIIKWVVFQPIISWIIILFSSILIWILAPVETENNPLDKVEVRVYRKRSHVVLLIQIAINVLFSLCELNWIVQISALGLVTEFIMLILGILKLRLHDENCEKNM